MRGWCWRQESGVRERKAISKGSDLESPEADVGEDRFGLKEWRNVTEV